MTTVPHFTKAHAPFCPPYPVRITASAAGTFLLFKDVGGDEGLRYAVRWYWNCRFVKVTINGLTLGAMSPTINNNEGIPAKRTTQKHHLIAEEFDGGTPPFGWILHPISLSFGDVIYLTDLHRYALQFGVDGSQIGEMWSDDTVGIYGYTTTQESGAWPEYLGYGTTPATQTGPTWRVDAFSCALALPDEFETPSGYAMWYIMGTTYTGSGTNPYPPPKAALTEFKIEPVYYDYDP